MRSIGCSCAIVPFYRPKITAMVQLKQRPMAALPHPCTNFAAASVRTAPSVVAPVSSRNIELLSGQSFSHGTFDGEQPLAVAVPHEDAETRRRPVRERHVPSRRRPIRGISNHTPYTRSVRNETSGTLSVAGTLSVVTAEWSWPGGVALCDGQRQARQLRQQVEA